MLLKRILAIRSVIDFSYLFLSNIAIKGFGFLREIILAYLFGTSLLYSFYILLRTAADFMSQFTFGNALQSNILPKLSKHFQHYKKVSYNQLFHFTKHAFFPIFLISQIIQFIAESRGQYTETSNRQSFSELSDLLGEYWNPIDNIDEVLNE